jgi:DNA-binding NarL/FixJ family response regulator
LPGIGGPIMWLMDAIAQTANFGPSSEQLLHVDQPLVRPEESDPASQPSRHGYREELTERELAVLRLAADGLQNHEIGQRLFIAEETVKTHIKHLLAKLPARSRAHAVALGFRQHLIN